jgi:thiol-disulfide isomerase/thioredoxin
MLSLPTALVAMAVAGGGTGQTVLLDFYSDSCGPCRSMMPTVDRLAAEGYPVQRVNVAQYPDLARRMSVTSIPCFVMIVDGRYAGRVEGVTSLGRLEQLCSLGRQAAAPSAMVAGPEATPPTSAAPGRASVPVVPVGYSAQPAARPAVSDAALLAASVRLRVEDPQGHSCGSGTIIDALPGGEALVLTCGHLFRDSQGKGKVEVDVFGPAPATHLTGRVLSFDLERDVAFIAFRPQAAVTVARVAPPGYAIQPGDAVESVGCDEGNDPTVQHSQINKLDKFLDPVEQRLGHKVEEPHAPWNLEVAGQPVIGRSGGGLFSADGLVIGVCNAAEPVDREGLYAGLGSIHAALDEHRMAFVYQRPAGLPTLVAAANAAGASQDQRQAAAATDPFAAERSGTPAVRIPDEQPATSAPPASAVAANASTPRPASTGAAGLSSGEQTTLDEIGRKLREGSEIVCIVRDRNDPKSQSQVFTLDRASPIFVNRLARAAQPPREAQPTSMEVAKPRSPLLEWDSEAGWIHQSPLPR